MNKGKNQHRLAARLVAIIFTVMVGALCALLPATAAMAQDWKVAPDYKVGDRVEIDALYGSDPAKGVWKKATVTFVDLDRRRYTVEVDAPAGQIPQVLGLIMKDQKLNIRPIQGVDTGPKTLNQKKHEAADGTVLADREILDCDFKQPASRNGSAPPPELMKKLIRCIYEKPAPPEGQGAQTVDISEFQIGSPRRWVVYEDRGNGKLGTIVYPIRTTWTWKHFERTYTTVQTYVQVFNCNVNSFNNWECAPSTRIKEGEIINIRVQ
jgi:hypothetical protein